MSKPYLNVQSSDVLIAPNGNYQGIQVSIAADDLVKAKEGKGEIIFWATAEYADVFEPKKVHHISVCTLLKVGALVSGNNAGPVLPVGTLPVQPVPYRADCNRSD